MGDGIREEEVVLRHIGARIADRVDGHAVHILPVHEEGAIRHIVGAEQQVHQCGLARAGLAHDAHALAGLDLKGNVLEHVEFAGRVAEGQVPELDAALGGLQVGHAGAVCHIDGGIQQLGDPVEGGLAAGGLFDEHRHGHDGPDDRLEIADVLHELTGVEPAAVDQIAAVAEDDADDRLNEEVDQHFQQGGDLGIGDVDLLVLLVQLPESHQLLQLFDEGLDDRDAGEVLLRKIGQVGKGLLALFPALRHYLAHQRADGEHDESRDEGKDGQLDVHPPHLIKGQQTQRQRIEEHQHAVAKALLNGVEVVGVQAHQVADLVHLIVLLRQLPAVVEHPLPQVRRDPHRRAEEADTPQKAPDDHEHHDPDHRQTDVLQKHFFGKEQRFAVDHHLPKVHAVDDQAVQLRDDQLDVVHHQQCCQPQKQRRGVLEVVAVDILAEYHGFAFPSSSDSETILNDCAKKATASHVMQWLFVWSGRRGSNSLPPPWQGGALPDELRPHMVPPIGIEPMTRGFSVPCSTD